MTLNALLKHVVNDWYSIYSTFGNWAPAFKYNFNEPHSNEVSLITPSSCSLNFEKLRDKELLKKFQYLSSIPEDSPNNTLSNILMNAEFFILNDKVQLIVIDNKIWYQSEDCEIKITEGQSEDIFTYEVGLEK